MSKEKDRNLMDLIAAADNAAPQYLPEHDLLAEVIKRAVWDAFGYFKEGKRYDLTSKKRICIDAQLWLIETSEDPWSYRWCCQHINIAPEVLLKQIEVKFLLGQMVDELVKPAYVIEPLQRRLMERRDELYESGYNPDVDTNLSSSVWSRLFPGTPTPSEWTTWPHDD
jgi:hypothetical protein